MMERKLYKTKLCILYQRGRCSRQTCSFAHGDAELRRFPGGPGGGGGVAGSFTEALRQCFLLQIIGRREYRGSDLRDKLERRYSPYQKFSPGRDTRGRRVFRNRKQVSHDRGYSPSRSPVRRSERRNGNRKKVDGQSDVSLSPRNSDGDEGRFREAKSPPYKERDLLEDKLREAEMDIQFLEDNRNQLKTILGEKDEEASKFSTKIEELNSQLKNERDDCRRLISKNKKFIKALGRYLRAQEELKRSQSRLQRVADQLDSDILKPGFNEEDSSGNVNSEGELNQVSSRHEQQNHGSPVKKRSRRFSTSEDSKPGISKTLDKNLDFPSRKEKLFAQSENSEKEIDTAKSVLARNDMHKLRPDDYQQKIRRSSFSGSDKLKTFNAGNSLPATSMAAQAVEELIEEIEMEEKTGALEAGTVYQNGSGDAKVGNLLPPPPPSKIAPNVYNQCEGDDEDVDVEDVGGDADVNSEVDIEK